MRSPEGQHTPGGIPRIVSARAGQALNSHLEWTPDVEIMLSDGRRGRGTAPRGETPSIYEASMSDQGSRRPAPILDELVGLPADQASIDALLLARAAAWGPSLTYALSVAVFEALGGPVPRPAGRPPGILFNLLNGGMHAYTNPIRADVTEVLLVPRSSDLATAVDGYRRLLEAARAALADLPTMVVNGNRVHDVGEDGDAGALDLARHLLVAEGLGGEYGLMVDASAGDWWDDGSYRMPVANRRLDTDALVERWLDLLDRHDLVMLEDPLAETDLHGWRQLRDARPVGRLILGDNFTSTRPDELDAKAEMVDGVLIKPDQNGTVTGTRAFADGAARRGLARIVSHRSIETESPFIVHLAVDVGADWVKIGPYSDFSSVLRTNELLRATR